MHIWFSENYKRVISERLLNIKVHYLRKKQGEMERNTSSKRREMMSNVSLLKLNIPVYAFFKLWFIYLIVFKCLGYT